MVLTQPENNLFEFTRNDFMTVYLGKVNLIVNSVYVKNLLYREKSRVSFG